MNRKQKIEAIAKYKASLASSSSSGGQPAVPASSLKPHTPVEAFLEMLRAGVLNEPSVPCLTTTQNECPTMPVTREGQPHRDKLLPHEPIDDACVARPVGKQEIASTPAAQAAMQKEWDKLRNLKTWDEKEVREWQTVASEARATKHTVHVGRIFGICVEKGSELPEGNPGRKYKGRVVFQGNNVKDENSDYAIFNELSSAPASMQAAKAVDAYGLLPGRATELTDAEGAYTQTKLGGDTVTWVRIPKE